MSQSDNIHEKTKPKENPYEFVSDHASDDEIGDSDTDSIDDEGLGIVPDHIDFDTDSESSSDSDHCDCQNIKRTGRQVGTWRNYYKIW